MTRPALVVHKFSFHYIRHVVTHIQRSIEAGFGGCDIHFVAEIDEAPIADGTMVFVVGENLGPHKRRPGCSYFFFNFSVVTHLGNPLHASPQGWRSIWRKARLLQTKLHLYDAVLDYWEPQSTVLQRKLSVPVRHFPVAVLPDDIPDPTPLAEREFDVCFVGSENARRARILEAVRATGASLSPQKDVVFEEIAAKSRICLNVHSYRSNHLETPRLVGAMVTGCPIVSEKAFGIGDFAAEGTYTTAELSDIASRISHLLDQPEELQAQMERASNWYRGTYLPKVEATWARLCPELAEIHENRTRMAA